MRYRPKMLDFVRFLRKKTAALIVENKRPVARILSAKPACAGDPARRSRGSGFIVFILFTIGVFTVSCAPEQEREEKKVLTEVRISLDSAKFQKVYNFIDHWNQDSLVPFLSHEDPSFRVMATYGFAGMMDDEFLDVVGQGVMDPIVEVRRASVYCLGQSYNTRAVPYLMRIFENQDSMGIDPLTFKYALEAIGKCADSTYLPLLAGISTYKSKDSLLLEGQSLGILKMAERGFSDTTATALMLKYATGMEYASSVRLIASNYLATANEIDLEKDFELMKSAYEHEDDPEIRMFYGKIMGRTGKKAGRWIRRTLKIEKDDRVKVALLRGSAALPLSVAHGIWAGVLYDRYDLVAGSAAELILNHGSPAYSEQYTDWAFSNFRPIVYTKILAAGNRYIVNSRFRQMVQELIFQRIRSTSDPYVKSEFITAAGQQMETARQLLSYDDDGAPAMVRTAILEAIVNAVNRTDHIGTAEKEFLIGRWKSGDVAALSILSPFFASHRTLFDDLTSDREAWLAQSNQIKMPEGVEARIQVDKARSDLFGFDYDPGFYRKGPFHTHDIDWKLYEELSDQPRAEITTNSGKLSIILLKKEAPGTVLNFIQLAESGYYNGRLFHRVVPNFVVQGGGNRGDGYGSLEYTIRSEVGPVYYDHSGIVGMASAGLHTESQQWFITLRPALHLDGKYTQFAYLTNGSDVLQAIRRGDMIENIKIFR